MTETNKQNDEMHRRLKAMLDEMKFWYQQPKVTIDVGQLQRWMLVVKEIDEHWEKS